MSEENVELTMRLTDAFNRRDVGAAVALWDDEGVLYPGLESSVGDRGPYRGRAGFRQYFAELAEFAEESIFEWSEVRDLGDQVLALGRVSITFASGVELDTDSGGVTTWRNAKCVRARIYMSHAEAIEAVGLRE